MDGIPPPPVVHHAQAERVLLSGVGMPRRADDGTIEAGTPGERVVYARRVPRPGGRGAWVQYWLWFADNPQDRGILRSGRHAGDWELAQLRLDGNGRPEALTLSQHAGQETCAPTKAIFAANGSHALYHRPGTRDRVWPANPNDEADGRGAAIRPAARPFGAWVDWPGRWGGAKARPWLPMEESSPLGPKFQLDRWDPAEFERHARSCEQHCDEVDECDGAETALGAAGFGALAASVLVGARRRRRRALLP